MDNPWGISGPDFLWLYGGLLLLPAAVSLLWWQVHKRGRLPGQEPPLRLTSYQLAWLAGGPARAAEAALATLLQRGDLRVSSSGFLTRTTEEASDPLERRTLKLAHNVHRALAVNLVRTDKRCTEIGAGLVRDGLLVPPGVTHHRLRVTRWLYVAVLVVGLIRWVNGANLGYPVGYLTLMLLVCVVALVVVSMMLRRSFARRTVLGDRALAEQRSVVGVGGPSGADDAAHVVATGGLAAYPDAEIRSGLTAKPPRGERFGSSGIPLFYGGFHHSGGGCSGAGASCGGGGGGGGGGCGGGGG